MINQAAIEAEIRAGLPNERDRRDEYRRNAMALAGEWSADVAEWQAKWGFAPEAIRCSNVMDRVVTALTSHLYREGLERSIQDQEAASEWLATCYQANGVDALWQEADRLSLVNHVTAFEVFVREAPEAGESPVGVRLWGGEELVVWSDRDDPRKAAAIAVCDEYDHRRRMRLWTPTQIVTYQTDKYHGGLTTAGGTAYREVGRQENTFGFLPFAFAHGCYPARYFTPTGPPAGTHLRRLNACVNFRLTLLADDIIHSRPIPVIEGASADVPFRRRKAGEWQALPTIADAGGNLVSAAQARYVTCDLSYLSSDWEDMRAYLDHALEMLGVPPAAVRMEQSGARSGISIAAEQQPLAQWAQSRQRPYSYYERSLARVVLRVAAVAADAGVDVGAAASDLVRASEDTALTLRWPDLAALPPGPDRDAHDQWMLDNGLMSRKHWLMQREHLTEEEAITRLAGVGSDRTAAGLALLQQEIALGLTDPLEALAQARGVTVEQAEVIAEAIAERRDLWDELMASAAAEPVNDEAEEDVVDADAADEEDSDAADEEGGY